jgi:hypothetical protein
MKPVIAILCSSLFFHPPTVSTERWIIEKNSNLHIEGKSNVAAFQCDVTEYLNSDTISFFKEEENAAFLTIKGGLTIHVNKIDCHQRYITNDLRKTLKADKIPLLKIDLISIGNFTLSGNKNIKGLVAINLAGVARKMEVNYTVQTDEKNNIHLCGNRDVLFSDFGLTAPSKLAGLIKVEERLNIRFRLILRAVQNK